MLDPRASAAWRESGEVWEAISPRLIMARFKAIRAGQRIPGGSRETRNIFVSVVSAYAPTAKAPPGIQSSFRDELQTTLDRIPSGDILILLGDFNARVGESSPEDDLWRGVRGQHGVGSCNEAGERLLEFCTVNGLTIMNTWFTKKSSQLATWKHPATKQWHMIDYIMIRATQQQLCCDVQVMRGTSCWTDHNMIRVRVRITLPHPPRPTIKSNVPLAVHLLRNDDDRKQAYQHQLVQCLLDHPHDDSSSAGRNWTVLKDCIMTTAEECVGRSRRTQPYWFMEARTTLQPLLEAKHHAHTRVLQVNSIANRREFRKHQRIVKHAVDRAKERGYYASHVKQRLQRTGDSAGTAYGSFRWAMQGADHHAREL